MIYTASALLLIIISLAALAYWISGLLLYARRQPLAHTPRDYDLDYEEVSFKSSDGLVLKGWWMPAQSE
jgi:uncharacterized protein